LQKNKLALEKTKYERTRSAERLANLKADRELFVVKSPADGIVYYGRCSQGNFVSAGSLVARLQRGGMIQPDEVLMTIVQPRPLLFSATISTKTKCTSMSGGPMRASSKRSRSRSARSRAAKWKSRTGSRRATTWR